MSNLFIGNNIIRLSETASTNSYAMALLKDVNPPEGTIVITENQTAGKGMRGNEWMAERGENITCSAILYPKFLNAGNHFFLSKAFAIAIFTSLTELLEFGNYDIKIKWPNDILVNNKKIAGVLIENVFREDQITASVVGIGLNVNQTDFGMLDEKATSLHLLAGHKFDLELVLEKMYKLLEVQYLQLMQGKLEKIDEAYHQNLLFYRQPIQFFKKGSNITFKGIINAVTKDGTLALENENGEMDYFDIKEISFAY